MSTAGFRVCNFEVGALSLGNIERLMDVRAKCRTGMIALMPSYISRIGQLEAALLFVLF